MRWIIALLVLVNVAILVWSALDEPEPANGQLATPGVGSIRLVGEPRTTASAEPVAIPAPPRSDGVMVKGAVLSTPPVAQVLEQDPADAKPASVAAQQRVLKLEPEPEADSVPAAAPEAPEQLAVVTQPSPDPGPTSAPLAPAASAPAPKPTEPVPPVVRPSFCSRIGPFASADARAKLGDYLTAKGGSVKTSEEHRSMPAGHWVMVPPHADRSAAKAVGEKLKAQGIKDFWIVSKGEYRHAISLGVFSRPENAKRFAKQVAGKGFQVNSVEKLKRRTLYWLDYQGEIFVPPKDIRARVEESIEVQDRDCP